MKITTNRKAHFEYSIIKEYNSGIVLKGSEVKSVRNGDVSISDSFIYIKNGEAFIKNMNISKYKNSHRLEEHDPLRDKKLILHKKEILQLEEALGEKGTTIIPLEIFIIRNFIKIKIGTAKGKKQWDKRREIMEKDIQRDLKRFENN